MGSLLELGWLAELGLRHAGADATAGLITSAAAQNLLPALSPFGSAVTETIGRHAHALIAEEAIECDLGDL
jgi:hypothetical protein